MTQPLAFHDPLRPVASQVKWWIVAAVALLLGAWELAFHLWMMGLPMVTGHRLNALVAAGLVAGVVLIAFASIQRAEERLAAALETLRQKSEALRTLEAERDSRLVDLAADLSLALVEIIDRSEIALTLGGSASEALADIKARTEKLAAVVRSLVELKQQGSELTQSLPALLEEYERFREAPAGGAS